MHPVGFLGIFVLLLGIGVLVWAIRVGGRGPSQAAAALHWPQVPATVTASGVHDWRMGGAAFAMDILSLATNTGPQTRYARSFTPVIGYRYELGGRTYEGNRLRFGIVKTASASAAAAMLAPYPVGAQIPVRFNPQRPEESVVEPVATRTHIGPMIFAPILIVVGLVILVLAASGIMNNGARSSYSSGYHRRY